MIRLFFIFIFGSFQTVLAHAANYNAASILPPTSRASLIVESLNNTNRAIDIRSNTFSPPASTMKLLTALAAKLELGDQFRFRTNLLQSQDDFILRFSGDPQLMTADLKQLLHNLKVQGINTIKGNLWLDNSLFSGYERAIGWPWDILGVCYSAPSSVITLDKNCVPGSIYTLPNGKTRVYIPEQYPIHISTQARAVSSQEQRQQLCDLELHADQENHYQLSGCIRERTKPLPLKFALQNTDLYTKRTVYKILSQLNIRIQGEVRLGKPISPRTSWRKIAYHDSKPLSELIRVMLRKSDNLIANNLTKMLGHQFFLQPGSFANGTEAIKQILLSKAQLDIQNAQLVDGSGLSRNNRLTANQMASVLRYIWQHDKELHLISSLPVAGKNGTLKYRRSMQLSSIKGHLAAKSGSIYGSYNMAGYGLNAQGNPTVLFVQFVSDYFPEMNQDQDKKDHSLENFEKQFYNDVIQKSQIVSSKH
ncbi:D-alanyl-D-alanine carboxypeptidase DacB precursor [Vibrio aerogenes CECT 7868]|uniref:D-alanyl-D-alanine carboxypeptidase DacB n=2 Tax=Vibrio aerogenes TaxID=92172 RepID=A0A1M5YB84_9VIBR|nr:serine-type D-Ala-D-Ala carboxypeptidase [Vibrio aerogenes]SHI09179.1 D-alanyl-D-alanine carboxypeptidase DacB precursor [Vibrio aerogenes CECT 7868]